MGLIIEPRPHDLGHGLLVKRVLPFVRHRMVGPFIFYDHAGPTALPPEERHRVDVRPHPHIGLATISYLLSGKLMHRDSLGITQAILPGEVNWMTAGRGIVHSERFDDPASFDGPGLELLQSWVALPKEEEETAPAFDHYDVSRLPEAGDEGRWLRLIAGSAYGLTSPVRTRSPLFYLHLELEPGARASLPQGYSERAAYLVRGSLEIGGERLAAGTMRVFDADESPDIAALEPSTVMLLGGEPVGERFIFWNFVSSRRERIEQAKADWAAGRFALPPHDNAEFIPLPAS
mgnify:CR=1 FL=1